MTAGIAAGTVKLRHVSHPSRPVYRSANASHASGTVAMPKYSTFAQKTFV